LEKIRAMSHGKIVASCSAGQTWQDKDGSKDEHTQTAILHHTQNSCDWADSKLQKPRLLGNKHTNNTYSSHLCTRLTSDAAQQTTEVTHIC
jgi:hypothetical protein